MSEKVTIIQNNTFDVIKSAVNKTVDLIKPTFGPASNKVIISKLTHGYVLDDGVQIARDLELSDPSENAVLKVVRETAIRTNDRVGDGTTGALIILQAIINEVASEVKDGRLFEKELKNGFEECKKYIDEASRPVKTREDLLKVARVSFDDPDIAKIIADAWYDLGVDGTLTVDKSGTMETFSELKEGITIDRGYISPYMVTNQERMETVVDKPYILFTDYRLTEAGDIIGIMEKLVAKKITSLVIVAENVEQTALATLIINKMKGQFNGIAISTPDIDGDRTQALEDMALMTGGKVLSESKGDKLENVEIADLGRADRFVCREKESVIIGPRGKKADINVVIEELMAAMNISVDQKARELLKKRIARFKNKIGVIKVGAATENEEKALKYKVEDAINATHSAFKGGVVAGAGITLAEIETSSPILNRALAVPFKQLLTNMGLPAQNLKPGEAINAVTGEIGPWQRIGVMDPANVLKAQIESAVSIASLLVTTSGMIVERPQHLKEE